jgi:hypothetical protein
LARERPLLALPLLVLLPLVLLPLEPLRRCRKLLQFGLP